MTEMKTLPIAGKVGVDYCDVEEIGTQAYQHRNYNGYTPVVVVKVWWRENIIMGEDVEKLLEAAIDQINWQECVVQSVSMLPAVNGIAKATIPIKTV